MSRIPNTNSARVESTTKSLAMHYVSNNVNETIVTMANLVAGDVERLPVELE